MIKLKDPENDQVLLLEDRDNGFVLSLAIGPYFMLGFTSKEIKDYPTRVSLLSCGHMCITAPGTIRGHTEGCCRCIPRTQYGLNVKDNKIAWEQQRYYCEICRDQVS